MWVFLLGFLGSSYRKIIACAAHQIQYWNLLKVLFCHILKNVSLMFYLPRQGDYLLNFYEGYMNSLSSIYRLANLIQHKKCLLDLYLLIYVQMSKNRFIEIIFVQRLQGIIPVTHFTDVVYTSVTSFSIYTFCFLTMVSRNPPYKMFWRLEIILHNFYTLIYEHF